MAASASTSEGNQLPTLLFDTSDHKALVALGLAQAKPNQVATAYSTNKNGSVHNYGSDGSEANSTNEEESKEFVVKLQPPAGAPPGMPWMCYDGPEKTFQTLVLGDTENLDVALDLLKEKGIKTRAMGGNSGGEDLVALKGYFRAKKEQNGEKVRVFLDGLVEGEKW